jgi:hypothetical protein
MINEKLSGLSCIAFGPFSIQFEFGGVIWIFIISQRTCRVVVHRLRFSPWKHMEGSTQIHERHDGRYASRWSLHSWRQESTKMY